MRKLHFIPSGLSCLFFLLIISNSLLAWSEHPMLAKPALKDLEIWKKADSVQAKSLQQFLMETETALAAFLKEYNSKALSKFPNCPPVPVDLEFAATGDAATVLQRFYQAIRVNPNIKVPLYLYVLPGESDFGRPKADPAAITTLNKLGSMVHTHYVWLQEGEWLQPLEVLSTANNEPDYGFDLGLFEDNNTAYGKIYGFGNQSFGNPNLEYSSQAPFHMGFYHEAGILYRFGPFLKQTYLDYRADLYKNLAVFAFQQQQDYWGWRFLGWSMHYIADATMPYHTKPLPGYSTLRMMWINLKAMLGFTKARTNAVQLVSNKHTVIEDFQYQELMKAHQTQNWNHPYLVALTNPAPMVDFSDRFIYDIASRTAADASVKMNKTMKKYFPYHMVSDPSVEVSTLPELDRVSEIVLETKGTEGVDALNQTIADRFKVLGMSLRSILYAVMQESGKNV